MARRMTLWYKTEAIARYHKRVHGSTLNLESVYQALVERREHGIRMRDGVDPWTQRSRYIVSI